MYLKLHIDSRLLQKQPTGSWITLMVTKNTNLWIKRFCV